jgi:hypothetical protein
MPKDLRSRHSDDAGLSDADATVIVVFLGLGDLLSLQSPARINAWRASMGWREHTDRLEQIKGTNQFSRRRPNAVAAVDAAMASCYDARSQGWLY